MTDVDRTVIAHHRLCARHASEWIPDENDRVCIFVESLVCDGELVEYVTAEQLRGAVLTPEIAAVAATLVDLAKRSLPPHISEAQQVEAYLALKRIAEER